VALHVVVITKSAPDQAGKVWVDDTGKVRWSDEKLPINAWDEFTVTEAVLLKEAHSGLKATVMTLGTEEHNESLKQALAIGCDEALRIWDDGLAQHDALLYSRAIAAAIRKLGDVDLVLFGKEFMDTYTDQHIYRVGRLLGWNVLGSMTRLVEVNFETRMVKVERQLEQGQQVVTTQLPAVLGLFDDINEAKYPSFAGIRKASKAVIPVWSAADLGIDLGQPVTQVTAYRNLPVREGAVQFMEGETARDKAVALVARLMEDKLL
jgi:electron transfer flavoprotein beta subunit